MALQTLVLGCPHTFWCRGRKAFQINIKANGFEVLLGLRPRSLNLLTLDTFAASGFALLSEAEGKEVLPRLVGRFWTPTGGLERANTLSFRSKVRAGFGKAAWNFFPELA
jgi:hypothetical protein